MSIIKSIKQVLGLGPAAENHFWDGSVPNQLSLKRGTPEAPGTELLKFLAGVASFPNQGQSLTPSGYVKLPGGLIVQWGTSTNDNSVGTGITSKLFQEAFPSDCFGVFLQTNSSGGSPPARGASITGKSASGFSWANYDAANALSSLGDTVNYIAIGY